MENNQVTARRVNYSITTKPQDYRDSIGELHRAEFVGKCVVCNRNTYQIRDWHKERGAGGDWGGLYDPDPRGTINDYHAAYTLVASEYGYIGSDVHLCFNCANTRATYERGLSVARGQWKQTEQNVDLQSSVWDLAESYMTPDAQE